MNIPKKHGDLGYNVSLLLQIQKDAQYLVNPCTQIWTYLYNKIRMACKKPTMHAIPKLLGPINIVIGPLKVNKSRKTSSFPQRCRNQIEDEGNEEKQHNSHTVPILQSV